MNNVTFPKQNLGFWYIKVLYPHVVDQYHRFMVEKQEMITMLQGIGFKDVKMVKVCESLQNYEIYSNVRGPFNKSYRDGDSSWSLLTEDQVKKALETLKEKIENDSEGLKKMIDNDLKEIGQSTEVICWK